MGADHAGRARLTADVVIVGAGAAGLATAIFARRLNPGRSVILLDGAARPGAKILISGGSRCNVTNEVVTERDFSGGPPAIIRRVLRRFPAADTVAFFTALGVPLHIEERGKLFPDSNRARDVLAALLDAAGREAVDLRAGTRVTAVDPAGGALCVRTDRGTLDARAVVLATGGQALPKSGSDGAGFELARRLGHTIVPTTPALVPLTLAGNPGAIHPLLAGVSHEGGLTLRIDRSVALRLKGPLLWTHFGISGPVVLDMSRHWLRARLDEREATLTAGLAGGAPFEALDARWTADARARPRTSILTVLSEMVPAALARLVLDRLAIDATIALAHLGRETRRRLVHALAAWPLEVTGSRGYAFAEATAGGVALDELEPATLASRRCPGLYLAGEILDVDGRLGGFNFQWAWSSARVVAEALARAP